MMDKLQTVLFVSFFIILVCLRYAHEGVRDGKKKTKQEEKERNRGLPCIQVNLDVER
jgi:hypothetical protein